MVLMHHLNAEPEVRGKVGGAACGGRACTESESQMTEESAEGRNALKMQIVHRERNLKCLNLFHRFGSVAQRKESSLSNGTKPKINSLFF